MYSKRFLSFVVILLLVSSFVFAQGLDKTQEDIDQAAKDLEQGVNKFRDLQKPDSWSFIFSQWKEVFLRNKFISGMDSFFTKINIVFLILFGMSWDLTPQMFFAFLFWIVMLFVINKYMVSINKGGLGFLYSLTLVVLLAQINLFEYVGKWSVSLIFYKGSLLWKTLFFLLIFGIFTGFWALNRGIAKWIKQKREEWNTQVENDAKMTFVQWVKAATGGDWRTTKKFN